jgi:TPR repeat protein
MRQSANQGITQSQNALAIMYMKGAGVQINYDKAYYWSSITTRKGSQEGKLILLYLIANL